MSELLPQCGVHCYYHNPLLRPPSEADKIQFAHHCNRCHDEAIYIMEGRPMHGTYQGSGIGPKSKDPTGEYTEDGPDIPNSL
jgi:hypothetical protein